MSNSIINFKNNFNGGTRANRFVVSPLWPRGVNPPANDSTFKIVSASLPAVTINTIPIPYRGRLISYAGDRQYSPWTIGIYDDNNVDGLWKAFQTWKERLDGHLTHNVFENNYSYSNLQTTWVMRQLSLNGEDTIRRITLYKCWPSVVGEINLNMGEVNFVAFSVTLTFDNLRVESLT